MSRTERRSDNARQLATHYDSVTKGFRRGRVTPVLGAGVNLCGRPEGHEAWLGRYLPSSPELAAHLTAQFRYPPDRPVDLLQVAQYIHAIRGGPGPLYDSLHEIAEQSFPTTPVHEFLAEPPDLRELVRKPPLIVTTNYDDLMEAALSARNVPFDLIVYSAEGQHEGKFCCRRPGGGTEPIAHQFEEYFALATEEDRRVLLGVVRNLLYGAAGAAARTAVVLTSPTTPAGTTTGRAAVGAGLAASDPRRP